MSEHVTVVEVGPRDGLQNEPALVPAATKIELIRRLQAAGSGVIEATSFVSPKWVPQMADAEDVMAALDHQAATHFPVLVPNLRGLQRALAAGAREVAVFIAASEQFSQRNTNCSIAESLQRLQPLMEHAAQNNIPVRGYISCVLDCPYEGAIEPAVVAQLCASLLAAGCEQISLGDTIGTGTPRRVRTLLQQASHAVPVEKLAVHFHDTYGQALANILTSLEFGVRTVDASVAGLGGCPYARGASGNVATEDVVYLLNGLGLHSGINLDALADTGAWISGELGRDHGSRAGKAWLARRQT